MHNTSKHTIRLKTFPMLQTNGVVSRTRAIPSVMISNNMCLSLLNSVETAPFPPRPLWHAFNYTSELPFAESPEYFKFFREIFRLTSMTSIQQSTRRPSLHGATFSLQTGRSQVIITLQSPVPFVHPNQCCILFAIR
jgi:hypothetical protein